MKLVDTQVTWSGRTLSLKGWAKQLDLPYDALRVRYQRGLRGDKLFKPLSKAVLMRGSKVRDYSNRKNNLASELITYGSDTRTLMQWAQDLGFTYNTLRMRYTRGLRGNDLFASVNRKPKPDPTQ